MATEYTKRLIIVVTADGQAEANGHSKAVDLVGGEQTFTVPLSPTGKAPATHYWCGWTMTPAEESSLKALLAGLEGQGKASIFDGQAKTPSEVLAQLGIQRVH